MAFIGPGFAGHRADPFIEEGLAPLAIDASMILNSLKVQEIDGVDLRFTDPKG